jgi:hypothetical protein
MWCQTCAQDVPGVPSLEEGAYSCARCSAPLGAISAARAAGSPSVAGQDEHATAAAAGMNAQRPPHYDGWEIEEQLRHAFRVLRSAGRDTKKLTEPDDGAKFRVDAGHGARMPHSRPAKTGRAKSPGRRRQQSSRRIDFPAALATPQATPTPGDGLLSVLAWSALSLGTIGFFCGLALLGWSANTGHDELWSIGTPIIVAGQIALLLGLALQLDRIWRDGRRSAVSLQTVNEQIDDLRRATTLLGATHGPSAAFYAHWAGGAGPEILLSDLKSQLDLLAVKIAKQ